MSIDWFTVAAQIINFLILVWLMKRFLYKPIINAINAREKRIAEELANADAMKAEALKERLEFKQKNDEIDQKRGDLMNQTKEEVQLERQRLMDKARQEIKTLISKQREALKNDAQNQNERISRRARQEVFAIAKKALADLGSVSLEKRLVDEFLNRLRSMDSQAKNTLAKTLVTATEPAMLRSAFDLPQKQRSAIQKTLNNSFSNEIHIKFETAPDLICGIELTTNGQKIGWNIADYLETMENAVSVILGDEHEI